jgi:hypothetical protein
MQHHSSQFTSITRKIVPILLFFSLVITDATAQHQDTIVITGKNINTSYLKDGVNRYLVYFRMKPGATRTNVSFWTRTVEHKDYQGRKAIFIRQEWEDKDSIVHTVESYCDAKTFEPLYHRSWWKQRGDGEYDFLKKTAFMNGQQLSAADTARARKMTFEAFNTSLGVEKFNWHIDLETFPLLPYREHVTFMINFYDPGSLAPELTAYTVTGSGKLAGTDSSSVDCWILEHSSKNNREIFWVSKKTHEVLQLDQEVNGSMYRYKIKLPFSK